MVLMATGRKIMAGGSWDGAEICDVGAEGCGGKNQEHGNRLRKAHLGRLIVLGLVCTEPQLPSILVGYICMLNLPVA